MPEKIDFKGIDPKLLEKKQQVDWVEVPLDSNESDWVEVPVESPKTLLIKKTDEMNQRSPFSTKLMNEAFIRGAANAATFGHSDEAEGYVKSKIKGTDYETERDAARAKNDAAYANNPYQYRLGQVSGTVMAAKIPAGMVSKAGSIASKIPGVSSVASKLPTTAEIVSQGTEGAIGGGLYGAGESEATPLDKTGKSWSDYMEDIKRGALFGGALGGVSPAVSKVAGDVAPALENFAQGRAVKAATGHSKKAFKDLQKAGKISMSEEGEFTGSAPEWLLKGDKSINKQTGEEISKPVLGYFDKVSDIANKTQKAKAKAWKTLTDEIMSKVDDEAPDGAISGQDIIDAIRNRAKDIPETMATEQRLNVLKNIENEFEGKSYTFKKSQDLKNQYIFKPMDPHANFTSQDNINLINGAIKDAQETAIQRNLGQKDLDRLLKLKEDYGNAAALNKVSSERIGDKNLRIISPSTYGVLGAGAIGTVASGNYSPENIMLTALAGAAHQQALRRGNSFAARAAFDTSRAIRLIEKNAAALGNKFPRLKAAAEQGAIPLQITHYQMTKEDPKYEKYMDALNKSDITDQAYNQTENLPDENVVKEYQETYAAAVEALRPVKDLSEKTTDRFITDLGMSKEKTKEKAKYLTKIAGIDFSEMAKDLAAKEAFEKGFLRGSKNVNMFIAGSGNIVQALSNNQYSRLESTDFGTGAGATFDIYAPKLYKKWLDLSGSKYGNAFKNLVSEYAGAHPATVLTAHRLLYQNSPEYKAAIENIADPQDISRIKAEIGDSDTMDSVTKARLISEINETGLIMTD